MLYLIIPLIWSAIFIIYCYVHEFAGHYLANLLSGISAEQMEVIWIESHNIKLFPIGITTLNMEPLILSRFLGGFIGGSLLLSLSIMFRRLLNKTNNTFYRWLFAITLGFSLVGFTDCIFETFFLKYHRGYIETITIYIFAFGLPLVLGFLPSGSQKS